MKVYGFNTSNFKLIKKSILATVNRDILRSNIKLAKTTINPDLKYSDRYYMRYIILIMI
jgi:hypothetical protein